MKYSKMHVHFLALVLILLNTVTIVVAAPKPNASPAASLAPSPSPWLHIARGTVDNKTFKVGEVIIKLRTPSLSEPALAQTRINNDFSLQLRQIFKRLNVESINKIDFANPQASSISLAANDFPPTEDELQAVRLKCSTRRARELNELLPPLPNQLFLLKIQSTNNDINSTKAAVRLLQTQPEVEFAQPNYIYKIANAPPLPITSTDPFVAAIPNITQTIAAPYAWARTQGEGITVAVIDTGINRAHADLNDNIWSNPGEIAGNCIDDDNNGYIDDLYGWSFADDENYGQHFSRGARCTPPAPGSSELKVANETMDCNGHGTRSAGIIAAELNNGIAIAGVAPKARIMPVKAFADDGLTTSVLGVQSIWYAAANCADVINNSWSSGEAEEDPLLTAVAATVTALGVPIVFSAGNTGDSASYHREVRLPGVISVAASSGFSNIRPYSNHGHLVDLAAPGEQVLSTTSRSCGPGSDAWPVISDTGYSDGTSAAAPHVAGTIALILASQPTFNPLNVRYALRSAASGRYGISQDTSLAGGVFSNLTSHGVLDALRSISFSSTAIASIGLPRDLSVYPQGTTQKINIHGDAYGEHFAYYELQLANSSSIIPNWQLVSRSFEAVNDGSLGELDLSSLPIGRYLVRVVVRDTFGKDFDDMFAFAIERTGVQTVGTVPDPLNVTGLFLSHNWLTYPTLVSQDNGDIGLGVVLYSRLVNESAVLKIPADIQQYAPQDTAYIGERWIVWNGNTKDAQGRLIGLVAMFDTQTREFTALDESPGKVRFLTPFANNYVLWVKHRDDRTLLSDIYVADLSQNPVIVARLFSAGPQEGFESLVAFGNALLAVRQTRVSPPNEVYQSRIVLLNPSAPSQAPTIVYTAPLTEFIRDFHATPTQLTWVSENFSNITGLSTGETLKYVLLTTGVMSSISESQTISFVSPQVTANAVYWIDTAAAPEGYGSIYRYDLASGKAILVAQTPLKKGPILKIVDNSASWFDTDGENTYVKLLSAIN